MIFCLLIISCNKESQTVITPNALIGKWYNIQSQCDSLVFTDKGSAFFNSTPYLYSLDNSGISFSYAGPLYIYIPESTHGISLDNGILMINKLNKLFFVTRDSDYISYSKQIPTKTIIGTWIHMSTQDTLKFTSFNDAIGKGIYYYTLKNDSMIIQYEGPDKLYVKPVRCKYTIDFDKEELRIENAQMQIYPNIQKGTNKYKRIKTGCN
jgi:hypothetical protein